ncbi:class I SAM-dependent methyltransferase [Planktomarina temperata]|nr:class I SAM-dependent methyltransferase [Planktomarina temperata]
MSLEFDEIHTQKKQSFLEDMMVKVNQQIHKIDEGLHKNITECPICSSFKINYHTEKYGFNMDKCGGCGLIFCNPYPTNNQISYYYNSEMKKFENEFFMESFENRIQIFLPRIEILKKFCTSGKLLDIGSSIGIFVEALNRSVHNFTVTCCDISEDACQKLSNQYPSIETINADYRDLNKVNTYDIVTMWDTVEHIVDQNELVESISKLLTDDGFFFFSTPNTSSFEWEIADTAHVQLLPPGHVNLMNEINISILLEENGFELCESFTLNPSLDIEYIKKLSKNSKAVRARLGEFLGDKLEDDQFRKEFESLLRTNKLAGNIVVAAQKKSG